MLYNGDFEFALKAASPSLSTRMPVYGWIGSPQITGEKICTACLYLEPWEPHGHNCYVSPLPYDIIDNHFFMPIVIHCKHMLVVVFDITGLVWSRKHNIPARLASLELSVQQLQPTNQMAMI